MRRLLDGETTRENVKSVPSGNVTLESCLFLPNHFSSILKKRNLVGYLIIGQIFSLRTLQLSSSNGCFSHRNSFRGKWRGIPYSVALKKFPSGLSENAPNGPQ